MNEQKEMQKNKTMDKQAQEKKDTATVTDEQKEIRRDTVKVMVLVKQEMYDKAIEIIKKYPDDAVLQTKRLEIAIKQGEYDILDEMCSKENLYTSRNYLLKLMTLATRAGALNNDYEKAKRIAQRQDTRDIAEVQSQMITILLREGKFDEIEKIGNRFLDNKIIQSHMITVAIKKGDYERIDKIANRPAFKNYEPMQKQVQNAREKAKLLYDVGKKIDSDIITEEDMQTISSSRKLSKFERTCIFLAVCEKQQKVEQAREIFEDFSSRTKIPQELQILDDIMQRIECGSEKFDFEFYNTKLDWHIHEALAQRKTNLIYTTTKQIKEDGSIERTIIKEEQSPEQLSEEKQNSETTNAETQTNGVKRSRSEFISRVKVPEQTLRQRRKKSIVVRKRNNYEIIKGYLNAKMRKLTIDLQSINEEERQKTMSDMAQIQKLLQTIEENKTNEQLLQGLYNKIQQYEAQCL